eukprot:4142175-Amphidinium_carterae.1
MAEGDSSMCLMEFKKSRLSWLHEQSVPVHFHRMWVAASASKRPYVCYLRQAEFAPGSTEWGKGH